MKVNHHIQVGIDGGRVVRRRDFLKAASLGSLATGALGWSDVVSLGADELRRRGKSCILLWMAGGPSQFETFSPKPRSENGGGTKAIATNVPGIQYSENLPHLAKVANHLAVIRSMTTKEGSHNRATALLHTGYLPTANIKYPGLGAMVSQQIKDPDCDLPKVVQVGTSAKSLFNKGGYLGVDYDPFVVRDASRMPANSQLTTDQGRYRRRLGLIDRLAGDFANNDGKQLVKDHKKVYGKAASMILSPQMRAFDLAQESDSTRRAYGETQFGSACLLARRLVETGVTFVELVSDGWDSHHDNFDTHRRLTGEIDRPFAALIADLDRRGLLDSTLVVWMGEFGRTPQINARGGRDHHPAAFNVALAGSGVKGGQVVGKTDKGGVAVTDRPVGVTDLFQSICHSLKLDADRENTSSIGRDVKIVDGGKLVRELF